MEKKDSPFTLFGVVALLVIAVFITYSVASNKTSEKNYELMVKENCIEAINSQKQDAIDILYQYDSDLTYQELQEAMYGAIDALDGEPVDCIP